MIEFQDVFYQINNRVILNHISFSLPSKGLYLLTGRNGSGKSTLLEVISGLIKPDLMRVRVNGKELSGKQLENFQRSSIHFVHQSSLVFLDESCINNIRLPFPNSDKKKARHCLQLVGLEKCASQKASELSSGERQRLSFCRIFYEYRPIVLLDEITSNLDSESKNIIESLISKIAESSLVLFVTHENNSLKKEGNEFKRIKGGTLDSKNVVLNPSDSFGEIKREKTTPIIGKGRKRNRAYYITFSVLNFVLLCLGMILYSFNGIFGSERSNPNATSVASETYYNHASAFYYLDENNDCPHEKNNYFYGFHYNLSDISSDIGGSFYDLALIPSSAAFDDYGISLARKDERKLGRFPENPSEIRISDYCYSLFSTGSPSGSFDSVLQVIQSEKRMKRYFSGFSVVGVYKGRDEDESSETFIKLIKQGYKLDSDAGTYYNFLRDTVIGRADSSKETDGEYQSCFLLNTEINRKAMRAKYGNQNRVQLTGTKFTDFGGLYVVIGKDGNPAYSQLSFLSSLSEAGIYIRTLSAGFSIRLRIAFCFQNKKRYLLLRTRGYKRKRLIREDTILHSLTLFIDILVSFGVSKLVLALVNLKFASSLLDPVKGRVYFPSRSLYLAVVFSVGILLAGIFFFLSSYCLMHKDRNKQIQELKTK